MPFLLFDTLTRQQHPLSALDGQTFKFYCCGPTVYGPAHIGNFRTFVLQDLLRRTLEADGMKTMHVRNLTDVDDKTIRQSQAEGKSLKEFTDHWTKRFHDDCSALNLLAPHVEPSAVAHIPEQIELIEKLIARGHAYIGQGSVYYRISSFASYGRLCHLHEQEITTHQGSQNRQDADEYQRESPADFALWKAHKPEDGLNKWPSRWGEGRPGWHIECSAMGMAYLGSTFDLHSGGIDLIFPHHENEIAQSEAATGVPFTRHWFHVSHLLVEQRKMSKSLGNLYTLEDILKAGYSAMDLRYVLLSGHYRQPLNFTWDSLHAAGSALEKMSRFDDILTQACNLLGAPSTATDLGAFTAAWDALNSDLNTPEALGELFSAMKQVEAQLQADALDAAALANVRQGWKQMLSAFGFTLPKATVAEAPQEIKALAQKRWESKERRAWAEADELRLEIESRGWSVKDGKDGYDLLPLKD